MDLLVALLLDFANSCAWYEVLSEIHKRNVCSVQGNVCVSDRHQKRLCQVAMKRIDEVHRQNSILAQRTL